MNLRWIIAVAVFSTRPMVWAQAVSCPADRKVVEISGLGDKAERVRQRTCLVTTLQGGNAIIHLGPDVDFDFSDLHNFPIQFGSCVTLKGVATLDSSIPCPETLPAGSSIRSPNDVTRRNRGLRPVLPNAPVEPEPARTSRSLGPVLHWVPPAPSTDALFEMRCSGGFNGDGARISGFRIFGPNFDDHHTLERAINVTDCHDVEISNMELAGWGG